MEKNKLVFILGLIIFILYGIYSYTSDVLDYINDSIILSIILIILFFLRNALKLTPFSFLLIIIASAIHLSGVFGFYNISPLPIQYDHFTHFIGLFAVSILLFNFFKKYFSGSGLNNFLILIMIILASLGLGSVIEQAEFLGFLKFGTGEGFLKFGGLGDTLTEGQLRDIDLIGGGWINTMWDLIFNFLGSLFGAIFMYVKYLYKKNEKRP